MITKRKKITKTGVSGTFSGDVVVELNYRSEEKTFTHAGTHDDFQKRVYYHRVRGIVGNEQVFISSDFTQEQEVFTHIRFAEDRVNFILESKAVEKKETVIDLLKEKGYE